MRCHAKRVLAALLPLTCLYILIATVLQNGEHADQRHSVLPFQFQHIKAATADKWINPNTSHAVPTRPHAPVAQFTVDLMPKPDSPHDDRIMKQLSYRHQSRSSPWAPLEVLKAVWQAQNQSVNENSQVERKTITIYMPAGLGENPARQKRFIQDECPINECSLEDSSTHRLTADVVLYQNEYIPATLKPQGQIWILWLLESPFNTGSFSAVKSSINWTATYRSDSTIVTPYEKFVHFENFTALPPKAPRDFATGKTKLVAWFVSNCAASNQRFEYAKELGKHISVDIYGACGTLSCFRYDRKKCDDLLKTEYKFYLAFENSNCVHYITEKFYWNALFNDVIPIVMGGRREDYEAVAPPHSIIHVEDFDSPAELAKYLFELDRDPVKYNEYFRWKDTGYFLNTKFWCRLCAMAHAAREGAIAPSWYADVESWWRGNATCVSDRWDNNNGYVNRWHNFVF